MLKKIYLESKSPRRKKILEQVGINFEVIEINIDESCKKNETSPLGTNRFMCITLCFFQPLTSCFFIDVK